MATSNSVLVRTKSRSPVNKGKSKTAIIVIVAIIVAIGAFIGWYNSDDWPWPSDTQIRERLNKVIDTCTDNEDSYACKNLQKKFNMTFKYCHSLGSLGQTDSYGLPTFPWYAVAWEGTSSEPPSTTMKLGNGNTSTLPSTYYGCKEHRE